MAAYPEKDNKEIRLFGEKSIREEAYRKKILQLEKDIIKLETLAKDQYELDKEIPRNKPENLNNLYYESLMSFDMRIKKEQDFLEKRATEITQRLEVQAQRALLDVERSYRKQSRSLFFIIFMFTLFFVIANFYPKLDSWDKLFREDYSSSMDSRIPGIRSALSENTKYRHNYTVGSIDVIDNSFVIAIQLRDVPGDAWYIRDIAQETSSVFNRFSGNSPGEINFSYDGRVYAKAILPGASVKPYIRYFR